VERKSKLFLSALFLAALFTFGIRAALNPSLPSPQNPLQFYSNQRRDDFRLVLQKLFAKATSSIHITMYHATDEELLALLHQRAHQGVFVKIWHDKSCPTPISSLLQAERVKTKGLMHRKIVVVDNSLVLLGSANMTTSSLLLHDNLSVGFYHPPLAQFLNNPTSPFYDFKIRNQPCKLWLLPDPQVLGELVEKLEHAQESIFVAMFTLTHPQLLQTLATAHTRGIRVTVALDHYAARGASKKAVKFLQERGVPVIFSQGLQLLHHKWAYIDRKHLILGSTNWTQAAFTKNQDCLLFIHQLEAAQQKVLDQLCKTITLESKEAL
jgi:phosphatidylserine/phosphatidylglycerophosphate/cardiolipin synthase-like enzyme